MNNNFLKYLMKNDPEEVISQKGIKRRRKSKPIFYKLLEVMNPLDLVIERDLYTPGDKPVIYVASHGFKDDALNTLLTIKDNAYLVGGNIDLFFNTLDGTCLWMNGVILVDRFNKESKNSVKGKMERLLNFGNSVVIFPEGTWNLTENQLSGELYYGFYEVAEKTGALVVPVATQFVGDKCYAIKENAYDITKLDYETSIEVLNKINNYINKASDLILYDDNFSKLATLELEKLKIKSNCLFKENYKDNQELLDNNIENIQNDILEVLKNLKRRYKEEKDDISELNNDIFKRVFNLLHYAGNCKKIVAVEQMRDKLGLLKYEILEKHANYSHIPREELEKETSLRDEWEIYRKNIINGTPYFYYGPEQSVLYQNPLNSSEEEVFKGITKKLK